MQKQFGQLMQRDMSRGEFLTVLGVILGSLFGFSHIIKLISMMLGPRNKMRATTTSSGYGQR